MRTDAGALVPDAFLATTENVHIPVVVNGAVIWVDIAMTLSDVACPDGDTDVMAYESSGGEEAMGDQLSSTRPSGSSLAFRFCGTGGGPAPRSRLVVPARPVPFAFVAATLIVQKPASGNVVVYEATVAALPEPDCDKRTWDAGTVIDPDPPLGSR